MSMTLSCPSCSKRFKIREESIGKRVRCPYCAETISTPTAEEKAIAGAPTAPIPPEVLPPSAAGLKPTITPPAAAPVASSVEWGASDTPAPPAPVPMAPPSFPHATEPAPLSELSAPVFNRGSRTATQRPNAKPDRYAPSNTPTPEQLLAPQWSRVRAGLCWVLFGLFLLALPGFVGFAKAIAQRSGTELPQGPGNDWVSIPGYINSSEPNSVVMTKPELLDAAAYGLPVILGLLFMGLGRLLCGAAPRTSGAKGVFTFSGLFTFVALAGLLAGVVCDRYPLEGGKGIVWAAYAWTAFLIALVTAEFWFLTGLTASGVNLKRPGVARAVGFAAFIAMLCVTAATIGWAIYTEHYRTIPISNDTRVYEQAAIMLGWLLLIGAYWRAVRGVRGAIAELLENARY